MSCPSLLDIVYSIACMIGKDPLWVINDRYHFEVSTRGRSRSR